MPIALSAASMWVAWWGWEEGTVVSVANLQLGLVGSLFREISFKCFGERSTLCLQQNLESELR